MPIYDYKCSACSTEFEKTVKMVNYKDDQECPSCSTMASRFVKGAPGIGDPMRLGITKPTEGWRSVLQKIHERTPGSTLKSNSSYI